MYELILKIKTSIISDYTELFKTTCSPKDYNVVKQRFEDYINEHPNNNLKLIINEVDKI